MGFAWILLKNIDFKIKLYFFIVATAINIFLVIFLFSSLIFFYESEEERWLSMGAANDGVLTVRSNLEELNGKINSYYFYHNNDDGGDRARIEEILSDLPYLLDHMLQLYDKVIVGDNKRSNFIEDINIYVGLVRDLLKFTDMYGVKPTSGLLGEMRYSINKAEKLLKQYPDLTIQLLQIRRHEKDFLARLDENDVFLVYKGVELLLEGLRYNSLHDNSEIQILIDTYKSKFHKLSAIALSMQNTVGAMHTFWDSLSDGMDFIRFNLKKEHEDERLTSRKKFKYIASALFIFIVFFLLLSGAILSVIFYGNILKPIQKLTKNASSIAMGEYDCDISLSGSDEIGVLAKHLQKMKEVLQQTNRTLEQKVEHRTQLLTQANINLQQSLQQLEKTRDELVQSEKIASLGRLVAGFSHEINTPIGVGVGSISALPEYVDHLERLLAADEVDGDQLDTVMAKIREMSSLCFKNLLFASDLVSRFKRTSVDQTSEQPRRFNVKELLLDVLSTVHHLFKKSSVEIIIQCPSDVVVLSQPGALGQVVTNLLINSFKHGFAEGQQAGTITINVRYETWQVRTLVIWFSDDGRGMEPEVLSKVFEPFFTTAKGSGGSGLGLYICHNIVYNQLMGKMACSSVPGQMTSFLIEIPVTGGGND
ncbi:MAG: ATP-binding protein [Magnetococcus sp. YQC-3]